MGVLLQSGVIDGQRITTFDARHPQARFFQQGNIRRDKVDHGLRALYLRLKQEWLTLDTGEQANWNEAALYKPLELPAGGAARVGHGSSQFGYDHFSKDHAPRAKKLTGEQLFTQTQTYRTLTALPLTTHTAPTDTTKQLLQIFAPAKINSTQWLWRTRWSSDPDFEQVNCKFELSGLGGVYSRFRKNKFQTTEVVVYDNDPNNVIVDMIWEQPEYPTSTVLKGLTGKFAMDYIAPFNGSIRNLIYRATEPSPPFPMATAYIYTADETYSSTTPALITGASQNIGANEQWMLEAELHVTVDAEDGFKFRVRDSLGAGTYFQLSVLGAIVGITVNDFESIIAAAVDSAALNTESGFDNVVTRFRALIVGAATPGTFELQKKVVTGGTVMTIKKGSWILFEQIA